VIVPPIDLAARVREMVRRPPGAAPRGLVYAPEAAGAALCDLARACDVLGARPVAHAAGVCLVVDRRYEGDRRHGCVRIGDCAVQDDERLRVLEGRLDAGGGGPVVFVDLETTGLSGGAGTVAFLVGCGWFDGDAFEIRQVLLPSPAAERALLAVVSDLLAPASLLVTYNGRAFDLPLMEMRWLFHRLDPPFADKRHLDMLAPARRLWRRRAATSAPSRGGVPNGETVEGCSLGALERALFGVERAGDVPGWEVPTRYFQFLRTGDARVLLEVLEHNRLDLVSLAALLARARALVAGGAEVCRDASEALALGKLFERRGRTPEAEACYRRAAAEGEAGVRAEAWLRLALAWRRQRRHREAAEAWRAILALEGRETPVAVARRCALEALAVHHEHRVRDFEAARRFALAALELDERPRWRAAVEHRLARLERKLAVGRAAGRTTPAPLLRPEEPTID
jgi:uncharacterized protein YprB with RNaseH-like and TPR domain